MKVGLGGYVFLTQVNNIIEPGRYETTLSGINNGIFDAKTNSPKKPRRVKYAEAGGVDEQPTGPADSITTGDSPYGPNVPPSVLDDPQDRTTTS